MRAESRAWLILSAVPAARPFLWHNIGGLARLAREPKKLSVIPGRAQKKRPARTGLHSFMNINVRDFSAPAIAHMMHMTMKAVARSDLDRFEVEVGNAGRDVKAGLPLHADRLQRVGIRRSADQEIAAAADAHRRIGTDAAVGAGELAAPEPAGRRIHRPGKSALFGDAEIEAEAAYGRHIGFGTAAVAAEHAFEARDRTDDKTDILSAPAL